MDNHVEFGAEATLGVPSPPAFWYTTARFASTSTARVSSPPLSMTCTSSQKQQFYTVMEPSNNLCLRLHVHDREVGFNVYHEGFFTPLVLDMNKFIAPNGVSKEDDSYLSHTPLVLSTPQCASRTKDPSVVQE